MPLYEPYITFLYQKPCNICITDRLALKGVKATPNAAFQQAPAGSMCRG